MRNIIIGIDPGIGNLGWAVVGKASSMYERVASGVVNTDPDTRLGERLGVHYQKLVDILDEFKPVLVAIEAIYFNRNISSCISTANVIGVIELACQRAGIGAIQIQPQKLKSAVGCFGGADKKVVRLMVNRLLRIPIQKQIRNDHEADAIAAAVAGHLHLNSMIHRQDRE